MVYYFAGYRLVYFMLMHGAKAKAAFAIKDKSTSLQAVSFTVAEYNELQWTEKNKEFSFHGQLYDIVQILKTGDKYTLKVYADKNETKWAKALNDFVKQVFPAADKNSKNAESMMSAFQKEYMPMGKLNINVQTETGNVYLSSDNMPVTANMNADIWHPPAFC